MRKALGYAVILLAVMLGLAALTHLIGGTLKVVMFIVLAAAPVDPELAGRIGGEFGLGVVLSFVAWAVLKAGRTLIRKEAVSNSYRQDA